MGVREKGSTKVYAIPDMECAGCAAKVERAIRGLGRCSGGLNQCDGATGNGALYPGRCRYTADVVGHPGCGLHRGERYSRQTLLPEGPEKGPHPSVGPLLRPRAGRPVGLAGSGALAGTHRAFGPALSDLGPPGRLQLFPRRNPGASHVLPGHGLPDDRRHLRRSRHRRIPGSRRDCLPLLYGRTPGRLCHRPGAAFASDPDGTGTRYRHGSAQRPGSHRTNRRCATRRTGGRAPRRKDPRGRRGRRGGLRRGPVPHHRRVHAGYQAGGRRDLCRHHQPGRLPRNPDNAGGVCKHPQPHRPDGGRG